MILAALAAAAAAYALGLLRIARVRRRFPARSIVCFMLGLIAVGAALSPALDERADAALSWHMVQHLVVLNIAAPLLLLGAPLRLALAALPPRGATQLAVVFRSTPIRALTHPAIAWLSFAAVLYGSHFSPLYNLALENPPLHVLEHTLYLGAALLFWTPLLAVAPAPHAPPHTLRLLAIFLALPMNAFLGFAFYVARHPFYAHYAGRGGALADQMNAGALMWIAGGATLFATLLWTVADWAELERRYGSLADAGTP
jgi:cytochrome c oxidase assembly factor CtaG